jgi:hypothetical protein
MKQVTLEAFLMTAKEQGVAKRDIAFKCPMCGTIQSMADLVKAGAGESDEAVETYVGFSCVGRFTGAGSPRKGVAPGAGCNWTLGGLFQTHELEIVTPDGKHHPHFELATPEEAKAHAAAKVAA